MPDDALAQFLLLAKERNISDDSIVGMLRHNGWSERRIYRALAEYYSLAMGTTIPSRGGAAESARDAFLYLLNFITLGAWSVALWQIWDRMLSRWLPDALSDRSGQTLRDDIAWQVALILVTFPIFVAVHTLIARELSRRPELYFSAVRRWLTYVALVMTAIILVIDAAITIQQWILGQLTTHFILDTIGLAVLGGGIFGYYLTTMDPPKRSA